MFGDLFCFGAGAFETSLWPGVAASKFLYKKGLGVAVCGLGWVRDVVKLCFEADFFCF